MEFFILVYALVLLCIVFCLVEFTEETFIIVLANGIMWPVISVIFIINGLLKLLYSCGILLIKHIKTL